MSTENLGRVVGYGVPSGGTDGQILTKSGSEDYETEWRDNTGGSGVTDLSSIAETYDSTKTYKSGNLVYYNNNLYKLNSLFIQGTVTGEDVSNTTYWSESGNYVGEWDSTIDYSETYSEEDYIYVSYNNVYYGGFLFFLIDSPEPGVDYQWEEKEISDFSLTDTYNIGDLVISENVVYTCLGNNQSYTAGNNPTTDFWENATISDILNLAGISYTDLSNSENGNALFVGTTTDGSKYIYSMTSYNTMVPSINQFATYLANNIINQYSNENTYEVGDIVSVLSTYSLHSIDVVTYIQFYQCNTAITEAEDFDYEKWDTVVLSDFIEEQINNLNATIAEKTDDSDVEDIYWNLEENYKKFNKDQYLVAMYQTQFGIFQNKSLPGYFGDLSDNITYVSNNMSILEQEGTSYTVNGIELEYLCRPDGQKYFRRPGINGINYTGSSSNYYPDGIENKTRSSSITRTIEEVSYTFTSEGVERTFDDTNRNYTIQFYIIEEGNTAKTYLSSFTFPDEKYDVFEYAFKNGFSSVILSIPNVFSISISSHDANYIPNSFTINDNFANGYYLNQDVNEAFKIVLENEYFDTTTLISNYILDDEVLTSIIDDCNDYIQNITTETLEDIFAEIYSIVEGYVNTLFAITGGTTLTGYKNKTVTYFPPNRNYLKELQEYVVEQFSDVKYHNYYGTESKIGEWNVTGTNEYVIIEKSYEFDSMNDDDIIDSVYTNSNTMILNSFGSWYNSTDDEVVNFGDYIDGVTYARICLTSNGLTLKTSESISSGANAFLTVQYILIS